MTGPSPRTNQSLAWGDAMTCRSCTSENQRKFTSEIAVHFSGLKNLDKPTVFVFPQLLVCVDCGFTEFSIPETELRLLEKRPAACRTVDYPTAAGSVELWAAPFLSS